MISKLHVENGLIWWFGAKVFKNWFGDTDLLSIKFDKQNFKNLHDAWVPIPSD